MVNMLTSYKFLGDLGDLVRVRISFYIIRELKLAELQAEDFSHLWMATDDVRGKLKKFNPATEVLR